MRSTPSVAALAAAALALSACASSGPPPGTLVHDVAAMEELLGNESEPFVIRIPEGTRVPVMVEMATPFVHAEGGDPAFHAVFDRTVYWYPQTPDRISFDGETWQPFNEGHEGRLSFGLGRSAESGVHANIAVALTPRGK